MPLYTYRCSCGNVMTAFRKIDARDNAPLCERKDGDFTVLHADQKVERIIEAPMVAPDIGPYQAVAVDVATGKPPVINSRSAHRDFLKRNGYTEVGNERVGRAPGEVRGDFNLRKELTRATREVLGKQK
jgi:hypothetical protein